MHFRTFSRATSRAFFSLAAVVVAAASVETRAATVLPVNFDFSTSSQYDSNFREPSTSQATTSWSSASGSLVNSNASAYGSAVFDTSATGGVAGSGGSAGSKANTDLTNVTLSSDITSNIANNSNQQIGYYFRLNSSDAGGYLALASFDSTLGMHFRLFTGASPNSVTGTSVFDVASSAASNGDIAANTVYNYSVTASGNVFTFTLKNGAATLANFSYTDATNYNLSAGQVGIRMYGNGNTAGVANTVTLDNLSITAVPEPAALACLAFGGLALLRRRPAAR